MNHKTLLLMLSATLLTGCEPLRGISGHRDYPGAIDVGCVDQTLRKTFGKIERWDYVSDGDTFPSGTQVAQLAYYHTDDQAGWATLKIGTVPGKNGGSRVAHDFTGIGAQLPQEAFPPALTAMRRASEQLKKACQFDLSNWQFEEIGQSVEALH